MKVTVEIELDESWDEYKDTHPELLVEDLFPKCTFSQRPDGIIDVKFIKIEK